MINHQTLGENVLDGLRRAIIDGTFAPGELLRQESIAKQLGVSRLPVRSALLHLAAEGLVVFEPRRGARVRRMTPARAREIYDLRIVLETHALRAAAATLSDEEKDAIVDLAVRLDASAEGSDFLTERIAFYRALYDAERHPVTTGIIDQLRAAIGRDRLGVRIHKGDFSHRRLAQLVRDGRIDAAEAMLRSHLTTVGRGIVEGLDSGDA